jgi:hypothetical protein
MKEKKANFFWHGQELGLQENVCIASFVKHNFEVDVYTYNENLVVPDGARRRNAGEILHKRDLKKYTQNGINGNLAAFSDAFRYHLLRKRSGWWFDADVLCLVDVTHFVDKLKEKKHKISLGYQYKNIINGAVLFADDEKFLSKVMMELKKAGDIFDWGEIGPKLLTRVVHDSGYMDEIENEECYYPVNGSNYKKMFCPKYTEWCIERSRNSLSVHLWNDMMQRDGLPCNLMPPVESFLYRKYIEICPNLESIPSISLKIINRLIRRDIRKECIYILKLLLTNPVKLRAVNPIEFMRRMIYKFSK